MPKNKKKAARFLKENLGRMLRTALRLIVLATAGAGLYFFTNIIKVTDGENRMTIISLFSRQDTLLEMAGVELGEDDKVLYTSYNGNYRDLTVTRKFSVPITVDGDTVSTDINRGTVRDCLAKAGVTLDEHDFTVPSLHAQIKNGDRIRVYRVVYMDNQYEETVPYKTNYKYSSLLHTRKNRTYTLQEGSNGTNLVTYRERYVDGELELALVSKVEVVKKPVDRLVLAYGNVPVSPLSAPRGVTVTNGVPSGYSRVLSGVKATGYSASRGKGASGLGLYYGSVAVNPNVIPYGTKMYIVSTDGQFIYGWAVATDTGTALLNGTVGVDLFYETFLESNLNGAKTVNVYIYG